mmetsp:Transcript_19330/g.60092  ORF Transcript_19330/g.60092 Transcript_19330/m.60092 type:complete len:284 (+) Transcript_19330:829-1680(+)
MRFICLSVEPSATELLAVSAAPLPPAAAPLPQVAVERPWRARLQPRVLPASSCASPCAGVAKGCSRRKSGKKAQPPAQKRVASSAAAPTVPHSSTCAPPRCIQHAQMDGARHETANALGERSMPAAAIKRHGHHPRATSPKAAARSCAMPAARGERIAAQSTARHVRAYVAVGKSTATAAEESARPANTECTRSCTNAQYASDSTAYGTSATRAGALRLPRPCGPMRRRHARSSPTQRASSSPYAAAHAPTAVRTPSIVGRHPGRRAWRAHAAEWTPPACGSG